MEPPAIETVVGAAGDKIPSTGELDDRTSTAKVLEETFTAGSGSLPPLPEANDATTTDGEEPMQKALRP